LAQRAAAVPDEAGFHRIAQADAFGIEFDLYAARLSRFGQKLDLGK
jgi:hypothetical protein